MRTLKKQIIILLICSVLPATLFGQKIEKTLRVEQGYSPRNDVRSIRFDTDGTMWIGTADGVLKKEKNRDFEWCSALGNGYVKDVMIDANDHIWVSLWAGGLQQSTNKGTSWMPAEEFGKASIMSVISGDDSGNYVATWGMGIYKHADKWVKIGEERAYEKGVNAILKDDKGDLWIGSYLGLVCYDEASDKPQEIFTTHNSQLPSNNIYKLALDKKKNLWVGTDCGLMNMTHNEVYTTRNSALPALSILALYAPPSKNGIWIGTTKGLAFFNGKKWQVLSTTNSDLVGDKVQCFVEREGKIYVGTDKGINVISYP